MPKLSQLLDGATVLINVNGSPVTFTKVGYNHYRKQEVTLLFNAYEFLRPYDLFITMSTQSSGTSHILAHEEWGVSYAGNPVDILLENLFPSMLDELVAASLVRVPLTVYQTTKPMTITGVTGAGVGALPTKCASGVTLRTGIMTDNTAYAPYRAYADVQMANQTIYRRVFLFSPREIGAPVSTSTVSGSALTIGWNGTPTLHFSTSGESPFAYLNTNRASLLSSGEFDPHDDAYWFLRGGCYLQGSFGGSTQYGSASNAWMPFNNGLIATASMSSIPLKNDGGSVSVPSCIAYPTVGKAISNYLMHILVPLRVTYAGMCLDGNVEVTSTSGGTISRATAIKSYRKLEGVWYRTI